MLKNLKDSKFDSKEANSLLSKTQNGSSLEYLLENLNEQILQIDLKKCIEYSTTLKNLLWEFDLMPFKEDLINYYSYLLDTKNEIRIKSIGIASRYDNWFYYLIKTHLKNDQSKDIFSFKNLLELIHPKSPVICKNIVESQLDIMNEFKSDRKKIGLLYHIKLKDTSSRIITRFRTIVESSHFKIELEDIKLDDFELKQKLMKYDAILVIFDQLLSLAFDESIDCEKLDKMDIFYRKIGRIMYQEFIDYGKNIRFFPFLIEDINKSYLKGSNDFFKYPWLLQADENRIPKSISMQNQNTFNTRIYLKPIIIKDETQDEMVKQFLETFLKVYKEKS